MAAARTAPQLQLGSAGQKLAEVSKHKPPGARSLVEVFVSEERQGLAAAVARKFFIVVTWLIDILLDRVGRILVLALAPLHDGCESTPEPVR